MDQAKVGRFIAALRKEKGLTQEALGRKLGVTNKTVSRWENGNYMPDIELLVPLGEALGVSVNELLAGERLTDEQFRKQADENLVEAVRESSFSVKERTEFFKRKWLREHVWLFVVCALACVLLTYLLILRWDAAFLIFVPWFVAYCWLRNRMMAYVEGRVYGDPKPPTDG
ncbi:MAG: helix-turn-helix domain-containing protein [Oscillospiraceae bacterium]|nr:helix-turn-helix domain-containing protein [Oscillospiraceae bacterium]